MSLPSLYRLRYRFVAVSALLLLCLTRTWAQSPPITEKASQKSSSVSVSPTNPEPDTGDLRLPIESEKPYSTWKHHVAEKPEDAIVLVRYRGPGAGTKTAVTGLVIRCDGFVLVPRVVRDAVRSSGTADVVLRQADGETLDSPLSVGARPHPFAHPSVPYALIKINDHHIRSLPLLAAANVKSGNAVSVLWAVSENESTRSSISSLKVHVGVAGPAKDTFTISDAGETNSIPVGAIVVDDESGGAVGFVTQSGGQPVFNTLARFNVISSEVGLAPDRTAVRLGDRSASLPTGSAEMVWVPGGPVPLDGEAGQNFARDYKTNAACTPGFWMAVQPVTNGQYRKWLSGETAIRSLPTGWSPGELQTSTNRREDRPVCGVVLQDAEDFAARHQTRLPTDTEWRRASYVRDFSWAEEMNDNWDKSAMELKKLVDQQQLTIMQSISMAEQAAPRRLGSRNSGGTNTVTNIVIPPTPELIESYRGLASYVEVFLQGQWMWGQVSPIDWFQQDVSIFGVKNVVSNAPEFVHARMNEVRYAPKLYTAHVDPDLTQLRMSVMRGRLGNYPYEWKEKLEPESATEAIEKLLLGASLVINWRGAVQGSQSSGFVFGSGKYGPFAATVTYDFFLMTDIRAGFRCAR